MLGGEQVMCALLNRDAFSPVKPGVSIIFVTNSPVTRTESTKAPTSGSWGVGQDSFGTRLLCERPGYRVHLTLAADPARGQTGLPDQQPGIRPRPTAGLLEGLREAIPTVREM